MDLALLLEGCTKALLYASLLFAIGASALRWLLLPRLVPELGADCTLAVEESTARLALMASVLAVVASCVRAWTHTVSAFGFEGGASWDTIRLIAFQSRWGQNWKPQMIAALVLAIACAITVWRRAAWPLATLAVISFTVTIPFLGHAAGSGVRMALHSVHILAAGVWLGTLAVVLLIRVPVEGLNSSAPPLTRYGVRLIILRRFAPVALPCVATVAATGFVAAYLYVGGISSLWTTAYGRTLLVKVALVGGTSTCGYINWRRLRRRYEKDEPSVSVVILEAILAAAVVLITAFLTETSHPG